MAYLPVTVGMEEHDTHQSVMLVVLIPVMPFEVLLALDHLSADGAPPVLLVQDLGTKCRMRRVCPRQSKPCAMGVMTVFVGDSLTPRSARKALIRGRIMSSKTCREVAVTMKSSAQRTSLMEWTRRCQRPPCPTVSRPSHTI
jgi:hypothetical protein